MTKVTKLDCMKLQESNSIAKRKCNCRILEERRMNMLIVTEAKLRGKRKLNLGKVDRRVSGLKAVNLR